VSEFRPDQILAVLAECKVDYVMIGGLAAAIHGSELVTSDLDITPSTDPANVARLSHALNLLCARIRNDDVPEGLPFQHDATSLAAVQLWNLTTNFGDLDVAFVPAGTQGYPDLTRDALALEILGHWTRVASLEDIIRSKEAAARPKDLAALPMLRRLLQEIRNRQNL
jgi:hypothetical protein